MVAAKRFLAGTAISLLDSAPETKGTKTVQCLFRVVGMTTRTKSHGEAENCHKGGTQSREKRKLGEAEGKIDDVRM